MYHFKLGSEITERNFKVLRIIYVSQVLKKLFPLIIDQCFQNLVAFF